MLTPVTGRAERTAPRLTARRGVPWPGRWAARAPCAQADPDAWFPDQGQGGLARAAVKVCAGCPVVTECLAHALAVRELHGIWGGLTARQRRAVLAEQENAA
jgi:WhiB family redox-sensing transcriptional regulator